MDCLPEFYYAPPYQPHEMLYVSPLSLLGPHRLNSALSETARAIILPSLTEVTV